MMLADLESIQKRLEKNNKKNVDEDQLKILEIALDCINNDKDISVLKTQFDNKILNQSGLLSIKPKYTFVMLMNKVFKMEINILKILLINMEMRTV